MTHARKRERERKVSELSELWRERNGKFTLRAINCDSKSFNTASSTGLLSFGSLMIHNNREEVESFGLAEEEREMENGEWKRETDLVVLIFLVNFCNSKVFAFLQALCNNLFAWNCKTFRMSFELNEIVGRERVCGFLESLPCMLLN